MSSPVMFSATFPTSNKKGDYAHTQRLPLSETLQLGVMKSQGRLNFLGKDS
eukprot:c46451_g1_i1 orf=12-164(+)